MATEPLNVNRALSLVFITAALTLVVLLAGKSAVDPGAPSRELIGQPIPELKAAGWLNGEPSIDKGEVLVIEGWATWCPHCPQVTRQLVRLRREYAGKGVAFVGLTPEPKSKLDQIREACNTLGVDWPNGYGAEETMFSLKMEGLPMVYIVGKDRRIRWTRFSDGTLEQAIDDALAETL